jgi:hypothetical protein
MSAATAAGQPSASERERETALGTPGADTHPARWRMLALLSTAELLGMSLWFAASAVSPQYRAMLSLSAFQTAWSRRS